MAILSFSPYLPNWPTFMGPLHCFVLCLIGDCGKIVFFAIFAKFASFAFFYGPLIASLRCALMVKLFFSPYLPNLPTFLTILTKLAILAIFCHLREIRSSIGVNIVVFAIFAKLANFYGPPSLLCALPRWRLWQNCYFRHIYSFLPILLLRAFLGISRLLWASFRTVPHVCFMAVSLPSTVQFGVRYSWVFLFLSLLPVSNGGQHA